MYILAYMNLILSNYNITPSSNNAFVVVIKLSFIFKIRWAAEVYFIIINWRKKRNPGAGTLWACAVTLATKWPRARGPYGRTTWKWFIPFLEGGGHMPPSYPWLDGRLPHLQTFDISVRTKELLESVVQLRYLIYLCVYTRTKLPKGTGNFTSLKVLGTIVLHLSPHIVEELSHMNKIIQLTID